MATFFGEVTLSSTRAYDEYEDELLAERYDVDISLTSKKKLMPSSLIISFGFLANDFIEGCIHNNNCEAIGAVHMKKIDQEERTDTGDFHARVLKPSPLFFTSKGTLLCQASEDITPKLASRVAESVLSLVEKSGAVMVLSSHHASKLNFASDVMNGRGLTFSVVSPNFSSSTIPFPQLPQPCVLDSLPAAIMTECLIEDRPCAVYASYTETSCPGDVDLVAEDFLRAISQPPIFDTMSYNKKYTSTTNRADMVDRYM